MFTFLSRIWSVTLLAGLMLMATPPTTGWAQQQQVQDTTDASALPTIAPREIEIRGTLEISLPSLERQPLSGFNPPPRIPEPSSDRTPYLGTYEQEQSDLPQQLPDPPQVQSSLERPAPPLNGELAAGGGRYFTRHAEGKLWAPLGDHESFTLDAAYAGSNGHAPLDDQPSVDAPYDTFEGELGLQSQRDAFTLSANLSGFLDTYTLYGAELDPDRTGIGSFLAQPDREGRSGTAATRLSTHTRIPVSLNAAYEGTRYETTIGEGPSGSQTPAWDEGRWTLGGEASLPLIYPAMVDADFAAFSIENEIVSVYDAWHVDGGGLVTVHETARTSVDAGVRLLAYQLTLSSDPASPLPDSMSDRSATYITPSFEAEWQPPSGASLYLRNAPGVDENRLSGLFQDNPYLSLRPMVAPTIRTTALEAGLRYATGRLQLNAHGGYTYAPSYRYFEHAPESAYDAGLFDVRYGSARIIDIGAEVSLRRINGFEALVGVEYRNGRLNGPNTAIPFFAPVTARTVLSYAFDDQRGQLQLIGNLESARYVDATETTQVDPYVDLDVRASYDLTDTLGLTIRVDNLSTNTLERWPRYQEPPLSLTAGMRVRW